MQLTTVAMKVYSWLVLASFYVAVDTTVDVDNDVNNEEGRTDFNTADALERFRSKLSTDLTWNSDHDDDEPIRFRRAGGTSIYQKLAPMSGGTVFSTDKSSRPIGQVIGVIKASTKTTILTPTQTTTTTPETKMMSSPASVTKMASSTASVSKMTTDFTDANGKSLLKTVPLANVGGRRGRSKFTSGTTLVPSQGFHALIHGQNNSGHVVTQQDPAADTPLSLMLDVPFHDGTVNVGQTVVISYNVTNTGGGDLTVKIEITDTAGFSQMSTTTTTATIAVGASTQGIFILTAGTTPGVTTTVTITALPQPPGVASGQNQVRRLTVQGKSKSTMTMPPTQTTTPETEMMSSPTSVTKMMSSPPSVTKMMSSPTSLTKTMSSPPSATKMTSDMTSSNGLSQSPTVTPVHSGTVTERSAGNKISTRTLIVASSIAIVGCVVPVLTVYLVLKRQATLVKKVASIDGRQQTEEADQGTQK